MNLKNRLQRRLNEAQLLCTRLNSQLKALRQKCEINKGTITNIVVNFDDGITAKFFPENQFEVDKLKATILKILEKRIE